MRFAVRLFCRLALLCVLSWMLSASSLVSAQPRVLPQRALPPTTAAIEEDKPVTAQRTADSGSGRSRVCTYKLRALRPLRTPMGWGAKW